MAYSYLSLRPPGRGRLNRAASSVLNPLSRQTASPTPTPDYGTQMASFMQSPGMAAPEFAPGTPNAASTGAFGFSNAGNQTAFSNVQSPQMGAASFAGQSVDYANDPILQQVQAQVNAQVEQARAATIAAEKTALIRYGSPDLVKSVLGDQADQSTIQGAQNNSFGTVQELGRWNNRALGGIDSNTNRNNLFFSSTRLRDRSMQGEDYTRRQASTANQLQDTLTGYVQNLLAQRQGAQNQLLAAGADAYGRAMQQAMFQAQMAQAAAAAAAGGGGGAGTVGPGTAPTGTGGGINGLTGTALPSGGGVVAPNSVLPPWWQNPSALAGAAGAWG